MSLAVLFGVELGRMDADHDDFVGIGLFDFLEHRQDVHAVDAAISPEVQDHELAARSARSTGPAVLIHATPSSSAGALVRSGNGLVPTGAFSAGVF